MLEPRIEVDPNIGTDRHIGLPIRRCMNQRSSPSPVLIRSVREEYLRYNMLFGRRVQQSKLAILRNGRVSLRQIGEGKNIGRPVNRRHRLPIP